MSSEKHLAQANIAIARYPMEDAAMAGFVNRLDEINAIADSAAGFVWRLDDEAAEDDAKRVFEDDRTLFNLTVWHDLNALSDYVYQSSHVELLRQRSQWFEKPSRAPFVLWWIDAGSRPTVADARARFDALWTQGPTPFAFTFRQSFDDGESS